MFKELFKENEKYLSGLDKELELYKPHPSDCQSDLSGLVNNCHNFIFNHLKGAYDGMMNIQKEHNISDALLNTLNEQASRALLIAENALKLKNN